MSASVRAWRYFDRRRVTSRITAVIFGLCLAALVAAPAHAATSYSSSGSFGVDAFTGPTGVAVDDSTGNVLVVDAGNNQVQVFGPGGASAVHLTDFGASDLDAPYGIAVDQSSHAVYVTDAGHQRILRYTSDGLPIPTYTLDGTYSSPAQGADGEDGEIGSFASPIAIDPRNGDLLVADRGNLRVNRYASDTTFLGSITGAGSADGAFQNLLDITVDASGTSYTIDLAGDLDPDYGVVRGTSRVRRFSAAGAPEADLDAAGVSLATARSIVYDSNSNNIVVATQGAVFGTSQAAVLNGDVLIGVIGYPDATSSAAVVGLAVDGGASGRLYGLTDRVRNGTLGVESVQVFDPILLPDLTLAAPSAVTSTGAHLTGTVDALGEATDYHFEYGLEGEAPASVGDGNTTGTAAPTVDLSDLAPNQTYTVRLVASNVNGSIATPARNFTTTAVAPDVQKTAATGRTTTTATLRGAVNPFGLQTTYHFEYGTTTSYGLRAPAGYESVAGKGRRLLSVAKTIEGLQPGTVYHYRLVARNAVGETASPDRSFMTAVAGAAGRAYEMVSPVDKGGSNIDIEGTVGNYQAMPDGNALVYTAKTVLPGSQGAPLQPKYLTRRTPFGWSAPLGLDPLATQFRNAAKVGTTVAVSEDGSRALVVSAAKLADGAVDGDSNVYLRDTTTGRLTTIARSPGLKFDEQAHFEPKSSMPFVGGTPDFSHVVMWSNFCCSLLPGTPNGSVYEWTGGQLRLASIQPDGSPVTGGVNPVFTTAFREPNSVSEDGSKIFFEEMFGPVHVRVGGVDTVALSKSERSADAGTPRPASFAGASRDGDVAFVAGPDLTDEVPAGVSALYRVDVATQDLTLVAPEVLNTDVLAVSRDGSYVYFQTGAVLAPGASGSGTNVYVWHDGAVRHIATLDSTREVYLGRYILSPSGRYFAFASYTALTEYDNSTTTACLNFIVGDPGTACKEVYRYDAESDRLSCASCRPDGARTTGNADMGPGPDGALSRHVPRLMHDDGRVFFDTPDALTGRDANSTRDVYSYDGNDVTLISAGTGRSDSQIADVSSDGRDVFFTTPDRLVAQDTDTLVDVYDARVGGGFPVADPPRAACADDGCRGVGSGPVSSPEMPSQGSPPNRFVAPKPGKAQLKIVSAAFRGTTLRLTLSVSGAGRIRVSGTKLTTTVRTTAKAGIYRVNVPLSRRQRALRRAGRTVKAKVVTSFTPGFGAHVTAKFTRTAAR